MSTASSSDGSNTGDKSREALLRGIAAGKRPASTPPPARGSDEDPDGPLTLLDQALELSSYRRQVRQRLLADLNSPITVLQDARVWASGSSGPQTGGVASQGQDPMGPPGQQADPVAPHHPPPTPAMPTAQFQDLMNGPWFNPFEPAGSFPTVYDQPGGSFMKMFQRPMKAFMALPRGFGDNIRPLLTPAVELLGDTGVPYVVAVHEVGGRLYFTHGWERFVLGERIQPDDVGLFVVQGPRKMTVRLYLRSGLEKPFSARPVGVDPDSPPPAGAKIHVPSHILGMMFELGPKVSMAPATFQTMVNVWATRRCNNPLYVCTIIKSQFEKKALYFGTKFSAMLPDTAKVPAVVFYGYNNEIVSGAITKKARDPLARLSTGFGTLIRLHGLAIGDILVVRIREVQHGYRVRVFKVPMA